jgi:hypothetical protein
MARSREPKPIGSLGRPSKWLNAEEKKLWKSLLKSATAVLGENDRTLMEITVTLKAKLENRTINNQQMAQLLNCLQKLAIIPKERVAVPEQAQDSNDPWDRL